MDGDASDVPIMVSLDSLLGFPAPSPKSPPMSSSSSQILRKNSYLQKLGRFLFKKLLLEQKNTPFCPPFALNLRRFKPRTRLLISL
jgi:hypothetical protein